MPDGAVVCRNADLNQEQEHTMLTLRTLYKAAAAAVVVTGLGLAVAEAGAAARSSGELVNNPTAPFACSTDEGYGRWTSCDRGG